MNQINELDIAIIGLSGRFPHAKDIDCFWQNLKDGVECISFFSEQELLESGVSSELLKNPNYVNARAVLSDVDMFDANFFGFSAKEAKQLDPQQRLFLESAWGVIENAGYDPEKYPGSIGIYAGIGLNSYLLRNVPVNIDFQNAVAEYQLLLNSDKDFLPTRVSYKLNLTGPAVDVQTACSTSLVAVHLACQSLLNGECDMALAGGVSILLPQNIGYLYTEGMITSSDGHCRAFDAKANGTVIGSGLGVVLLKRLEDAIADRDHIHAIIKGSAINNDGSLKVSYTAPSTKGQAQVIAQAQAVAEVDAESISYIEAHGTGTKLGDPIEIAALTKAFRRSTQKKNFCAIGSLKTNMGHLDAAAGVAGLIKTVLALKHKLIPPSLNFEEPSPNIDFANSPFYVNSALSEWDSNGTPRRAGVSSFGIGGTNAHVVLEEAPLLPASGKSRARHLLLISAKTSSALEEATANLGAHLQENSELNLADVAFTLSCGRRAFEHRRILVCQESEKAAIALSNLDSQQVFSRTSEIRNRPVVFMFSGQGSQYVNMALELYESELLFRQQVDLCSEILRSELDLDIRQILYPQPGETQTAQQQLQQTAIAQPAIFVVEYALAKLWQSWGISPQAMIGHSIGEYVAATLAGVFSLEAALLLVAARGKMMQQLPKGAMLSIPLPVGQVQPLLTKEISVAVINETSRCVVSGSLDAIANLETALASRNINYRLLHTSHAFHSQMMEPILDEFRQRISQESLNSPQIPYISNLTGEWITKFQATDPNYWVQHLRQTVQFAKGIENLLQNPEQIFLEVGPGRTLTSLTKRHPARHSQQLVLTSVRHPQEDRSDLDLLLNSLGHLWLAGVEVNWSEFYIHEERDRLPLPTYPFQRQRYWIDAIAKEKQKSSKPQSSNTQIVDLINRGETGILAQKLQQGGNLSVEQEKSLPDILKALVKQHQQELNNASIKDWLYQIEWQSLKHNFQIDQIEPGNWLIFADKTGVAEEIEQKLQRLGCECSLVYRGDRYQQIKPGTYQLNPTKPEEFEQLITEIQSQSELSFQKIIHLWSLDIPKTEDLTIKSLESAQHWGCGAVLHLVQALIKNNNTAYHRPQLWLVTRTAQPMLVKAENVSVAAAPLWGMGRVVSLEHPQILGGLVDLDSQASASETEKILQFVTDTDFKEDHLVVRGEQTYVARLVKQTLPEVSSSVSFEPEATYLITGGLGALGLHTTKWMVEKGATNIVLVSRSKPSLEKQAIISELQQQGAEIVVAQADVCNQEEVARIYQQIEKLMPPLKGIIHAAGILDDGVLAQMNWEQFTKVMAPKVKGAWNLHKFSQNLPLDFFICFSSTASILGSPGQGNYAAANAFLDGIVRYRQELGLPGLSINWGAWAQSGMSANLAAVHQNRMHSSGISPIEPEKGMLTLEQILVSRFAQGQVGVIPVDWSLLAQHITYSPGSLLREILEQEQLPEQKTARVQAEILAEIAAQPESERMSLLIKYIQKEVAKVLGLDNSELPSPEQGLLEMGMDSLTALEIRNLIMTNLGINISMTRFIEGGNIITLSTEISEQLGQIDKNQSNGSKEESKTFAMELNKNDFTEGEL